MKIQFSFLPSVLLAMSTALLAQDTTPPLPLRAQTFGAPASLTVTFSEDVSAVTAGNAANYSLDQGATVSTATVLSPTQVRLATSALNPAQVYSLTVKSIADMAVPPNPMPAPVTILVNHAQGAITFNVFEGIFGTSVDDLLASEKYPGSPDASTFATRVDYNDSRYAIRALQFVGYLHPDETGYYYFFAAGKDDSRLLLSTDETPANKTEIVYRGLGGYQDFSEAMGPVELQAGKKYYLEVLGKIQWGGGYLSAGWQHENWPGPQLITGANLSTLVASGPVAITTPPASASVLERSKVTLSVKATGTPPYTYQWKRNGADVPGAAGADLVIDRVALSDAGDYTVVVANSFSSATSAKAVLTVVPASGVPGPDLLSAGSFGGTKIGLRFDSELDPATATQTSNYKVYGEGKTVTVTKATLGADQTTVVLDLSLVGTLSNPFTVLAQNLKDKNGVVMGSPGLIKGAVQDLTLTDIGDPVEKGVATAYGPDQLEITAGGLRTWDTSDSFTYVHTEPRTGDFDVRVRVDEVEQLGAPGGDPKAALMARANLTAGSPNVSLNVVSTRKYIEYLYRPDQDGGTTEFDPSTSPGLEFPVWVRLQRVGNHFIGSRSQDGVAWTQISEGEVALPDTVMVGLNTNADRDQAGSRLRVAYSHFSAASTQGYTATDIGDPIEPGQVRFGSDVGEVDVVAGGLRTWDTSDSFNFVHRPKTGDFDVKVRVDRVEQLGSPGGDPKAALMARANLTAGSPNVSLNVVATRKYIEYLYRPVQDQGTTEFDPSTSPGLELPVWIRLQRIGDVFTSLRSQDGVNWTRISSGTVDLPDTLLVGLNTNADKDEAGAQLSVHYTGLGDVSTYLTLADMGLTLTDIGEPVEAGYAVTPDGLGDIDVTAGGLRTWDTSDSFTFIHGPKRGDFDVQVRIDKTEQIGAPGGDPKAALMARENLTAGSANVSLNVVPTRNYIEYLYRPEQDAGTTEFNPSTSPGLQYPQWIRLQRVGNQFIGWRSSDGRTWSQISQGEVGLAEDLLVGLNTNADRDEAGSQLAVQYRDFGDYVAPPIVTSPTITVSRSGNNLVLVWPDSAGTFAVEGTGSLAHPISWSPVPGNPTVANGQVTFLVPISGNASFLRLRESSGD